MPEEQDNKQPGVPEPEEKDTNNEDKFPDDATEQTDETSRTQRTRQAVERLTYDRLGETHTQKDGNRKISFANERIEMCHNIMTDDNDKYEHIEYNTDKAEIMARIMVQINEAITDQGLEFVQRHATEYTTQFAQQYIYEKGLKKFGERGKQAAIEEWDQLHRRKCFVLIEIASMTQKEKERAQQALVLLTEKRDGSIKGRTVYNGKPTREWLSREDTMSPTA